MVIRLKGERCVTVYVPWWRAGSAVADRFLLDLILEVARFREWRGRPQMVEG